MYPVLLPHFFQRAEGAADITRATSKAPCKAFVGDVTYASAKSPLTTFGRTRRNSILYSPEKIIVANRGRMEKRMRVCSWLSQIHANSVNRGKKIVGRLPGILRLRNAKFPQLRKRNRVCESLCSWESNHHHLRVQLPGRCRDRLFPRVHESASFQEIRRFWRLASTHGEMISLSSLGFEIQT